MTDSRHGADSVAYEYANGSAAVQPYWQSSSVSKGRPPTTLSSLHTASSSSSLPSSITRKRKRGRSERAFLVIFFPLCVVSFFAARTFGQQLRASGYAASIDAAYDTVISSTNDLFGTTANAIADDDGSRINADSTVDMNAPKRSVPVRPGYYSYINYTSMYNYSSVPITNSTIKKIYLLPQEAPNPLAAGELKHFMQDAIHRSKRLVETHDPLDPEAAWMFDPVRIKWFDAVDIVKNTTRDRLVHMKQQMRQQGVDEATIAKQDTVPSWEFYIMDYTDEGFVFALRMARDVAEAMGSSEPVLRFGTRKHVQNRGLDVPMNDTQPFAPLGRPINWTKHPQFKHLYGVPRVLRYGVRSDLADYLEHEFNGTFYEAEANSTGKKLIDLVSLDRPNDVFHPWRPGTDERLGKHRGGIALALHDLMNTQKRNQTARDLAMILVPMGSRSRPGRNSVQKAYVDTLLESKIVVTSQRDRWEDHYRLMEALATGSLVMTDPMSTLPHYLRDGESLVVYHSLGELKEKILYYLDHEEERLAIARKGHWIAMNHHRSWHGLERIMFGNWSKPMGRRR